jgi:hypothetical protein
MGANWIHNMTNSTYDSIRDFRYYTESFLMHILKKTEIYCDPNNYSLGYLVATNWRFHSPVAALFYSGTRNGDSEKSEQILLEGLQYLLERSNVVWLTVFESPRSYSLKLDWLPDNPPHRISFRYLRI